MPQPFIKTGEVLRKFRLEAKLTQAELADACKAGGNSMHTQFVSNWERGLCLPPNWALKPLAKALKFGPKRRDDFYDDNRRVAVWEALSEDYDRMIMNKYAELV